MKPLLFVHAGGTKTGSSALQSFLELNSDKLRDYGISYENKVGISFQHEISSGNGDVLFNALKLDVDNSVDIEDLILSYMGESSVAICSSENFSLLSSHQWGRLADVCNKNNIDLRVVFYIRNVLSFMQSAYDQGIKRHGESRNFNEWVESIEWPHSLALRAIVSVLPIQSITVLSYENINKKVVDSFSNLVGFLGGKQSVDTVVNRSLTTIERNLLRKVNLSTGSLFSTELSNRLVYAHPEVKSELVKVDKITEQMLENKFRGEVDWINETFFSGQSIVDVATKDYEHESHDYEEAISKSFSYDVYDIVLTTVLNKLSCLYSDSITQLMENIKNIDWSLENHVSIPPDFDPVAYLLNNHDVLIAGVPPFAHFIANGCFETNRVWTWGKDAKWTKLKKELNESMAKIYQLEQKVSALESQLVEFNKKH